MPRQSSQLRRLQRVAARRRLRRSKRTTQDVISMRGRRHVMEAALPDQPQTAQAEFLESTAIREFSYDEKTGTLEIIFVTGRKYWFLKVSLRSYGAFKTAQSKGRHFNKFIRNTKKYGFHYNFIEK